MDEQLRELFKKAFDEGSMYESTLSSAYGFDSFIEDNIEQLRLYGVSVSLPSDPMVLAEYLHDNYEQIAKRTNWQTQKNCKVEFKDLPIENKNTMILLAGKLILDFVGNER